MALNALRFRHGMLLAPVIPIRGAVAGEDRELRQGPAGPVSEDSHADEQDHDQQGWNAAGKASQHVVAAAWRASTRVVDRTMSHGIAPIEEEELSSEHSTHERQAAIDWADCLER
jgi:hypothetical protein